LASPEDVHLDHCRVPQAGAGSARV
jgi:hypothetical protein